MDLQHLVKRAMRSNEGNHKIDLVLDGWMASVMVALDVRGMFTEAPWQQWQIFWCLSKP